MFSDGWSGALEVGSLSRLLTLLSSTGPRPSTPCSGADLQMWRLQGVPAAHRAPQPLRLVVPRGRLDMALQTDLLVVSSPIVQPCPSRMP